MKIVFIFYTSIPIIVFSVFGIFLQRLYCLMFKIFIWVLRLAERDSQILFIAYIFFFQIPKNQNTREISGKYEVVRSRSKIVHSERIKIIFFQSPKLKKKQIITEYYGLHQILLLVVYVDIQGSSQRFRL